MFGLMTKARHEDAMGKKSAEITRLSRGRAADHATIDALDKSARKFRQERDALQAKVDRMTAPLRAANEARKLKAAN